MRPSPRNVLPALALAGLASLMSPGAAAQTGPWSAGEIILMNPDAGAWKVLRIDPLSGDAEILIEPRYWGGWADPMEFDTWRNAMVVNMSLHPDGPFNYKPWVVSSDGSAVALPGLDSVSLRGIATTGDGRIYLQRNTFGNGTIEYYDAGNQLHTLMDETGTAPFDLRVEHVLYDPAGDALIAVHSVHWTPGSPCSTTANSVYRIPLSADGSQVAGPVTCTTLLTANENLLSLDHLPGGDMLLVAQGLSDDKFWRIDPSGPSASLWATCLPDDLNGGVHVDALGAAVVMEDASNQLRIFGPGSSGTGTTLPVDMPVGDGSTGFSPADYLVDINALGAACAGFTASYGSGKAGQNGVVPKLTGLGCPDIGRTFSLIIDDVVGAATGILFLGLDQASVPFKGGTFLVGDVVLQIPLTMPGTAFVPGQADASIPLLLNDPLFIGLDLYWQAGFVDQLATNGVSLTNGVQVQAA